MTKEYSTTPIGQFDKQYRDLVLNVLDNGYSSKTNEHCVRTVYADGNEAHYKSTIGQRFHFDNTEVPVSTSKRLAWKSAIKELLWIWQKKSNVVQDLRDMGVNIWNEWEQKDGTIGKAYGYQMGKRIRKIDTVTAQGEPKTIKLDQVDYLLYQLRNNPNSRRHITMLWSPDELDEMSLTPCVYETQWHVKENKLHLEVRARSNDMALTY